jgi:hypothetical protein
MRLSDAMREREYFSPQDFNTSPLGRLAHAGRITRAEYEAGVRWRDVYLGYLKSIGAPEPYGNSGGSLDAYSDELCEELKRKYLAGVKILESCGVPRGKYTKSKRVLHAVNAVAVFEESEELGDFEFTAAAAKIGLAALAQG